jgi:hypothetical protein
MSVRKIIVTVMFFAVAFFFSWVMNLLVHSIFPPDIANYINDGASAAQIVLILFATGFMDKLNCKK